MRKYLSAAFFALIASTSVATFANESSSAAVSTAAEQAIIQVNINEADAETLTRELSGIGASKAKAIVDYRDEHGPFQNIDELLEVKGIGASTLEKNKTKITI
ncbi:ComEA family DNA-binding protein [Pseudomonas matsuisoli]|uniref:Competence protein ComEA n=1 Tax=Pseudomonas matsuisoli TaxID=1515666 RepID=A0A917URH2_9PSED|nr:helix-hairpin-helix domain-containing protein [Pseudomonas matsuisoli]GGJ79143.1 competence protein ComEA [Pseudomonas matsuisoli]